LQGAYVLIALLCCQKPDVHFEVGSAEGKRGGVGSLRQKLFEEGVGGAGEMRCGTRRFVKDID
jgi:hypothetical protein